MGKNPIYLGKKSVVLLSPISFYNPLNLRIFFSNTTGFFPQAINYYKLQSHILRTIPIYSGFQIQTHYIVKLSIRNSYNVKICPPQIDPLQRGLTVSLIYKKQTDNKIIIICCHLYSSITRQQLHRSHYSLVNATFAIISTIATITNIVVVIVIIFVNNNSNNIIFSSAHHWYYIVLVKIGIEAVFPLSSSRWVTPRTNKEG
eukprot:TRINITY_DN5009_c0_g1_i3.p2 TRINITY_DN5009_c0_g1~~TRINITY_DN5009_c0_g1_i3.p2  ORF type:complete len:202 (-),score=-7.15 TRINITY_DN5009_c0_g1_i3:122-727(-)